MTRDSYTTGWLTEAELDLYREDLPLGTWVGVVEHTRYGKKKPGVHLYLLREGTQERYWTFIGWMGGNETYTLVKDNAFPGARFEFSFVERTTRLSTKPRLASLSLLTDENAEAGNSQESITG